MVIYLNSLSMDLSKVVQYKRKNGKKIVTYVFNPKIEVVNEN